MTAARTPNDAGCGSQQCITCGDVGEPMTIVEVDREGELALCSGHDGLRETVETALVSPVRSGEVVLVHAGTAIARLDREVPA